MGRDFLWGGPYDGVRWIEGFYASDEMPGSRTSGCLGQENPLVPAPFCPVPASGTMELMSGLRGLRSRWLFSDHPCTIKLRDSEPDRSKGFVLAGSFPKALCLALRFKAEDLVSGKMMLWPLKLARVKLALGWTAVRTGQ